MRQQRIAAVKVQFRSRAVALRRQRVERMVPGAILCGSAAGVGSVALAGALRGGAAVGSHVVRAGERLLAKKDEDKRKK